MINKEINKIVIVGGGSSGWISASFLVKTFPEKEIVIIESKNIPTIGVGESTLVDFANLRDYLEINEREFMRGTNASYKMSIKFTDFYEKNDTGFHLPFRIPDLFNTSDGLYDWLEIKSIYKDLPVQDFARCYFPHTALFESNKFSDNRSGEFGASFNPKTDVGYHFDSTLFGQWLKTNYCLPKGVKVINDDVVEVLTNENGVESLILSSKTKIIGDLYIDCTGFNSLLLGKSLEEPFDDFSHILQNNNAVAVQIPYKDKERELQGFTNCTAIENGWCWNVPLWSRLGTGYVYSDQYISKEEAKEEFINYLKSDKMLIPRTDKDIENLNFKHVSMKPGTYKRTWVKNVVAIGLSAGFIEPLESNSLFTVYWYLRRLAKSLLRGRVTQWDMDVYNTTTRGLYNNFSEFVALHYALSIRNDTQYWKDITEKTYSKEMVDLIPVHTVGFFDLQNKKMFNSRIDPTAGITYVSVGMNYFLKDRIDSEWEICGDREEFKNYVDKLKENFEIKKSHWKSSAEKCPTLYQYLKSTIYND